MPKIARKFNLFFAIIALGPVMPLTEAQAEWELVHNDKAENIQVYYRTLANGNVAFKGETKLRASMATIVAVFLDLTAMPEWLYRTRHASLLARPSETEMLVYTQHNMPFPFRDRDSVNRIELRQSAKSNAVTIQLHAKPDHIAEKSTFVRVAEARSSWQLTPQGNGTTLVRFQGYGDPGGSLSAAIFRTALFRWLVKSFLWQVPHQSLMGLRAVVKRERYQNRSFPFLSE
jgi:hypothetical protein